MPEIPDPPDKLLSDAEYRTVMSTHYRSEWRRFQNEKNRLKDMGKKPFEAYQEARASVEIPADYWSTPSGKEFLARAGSKGKRGGGGKGKRGASSVGVFEDEAWCRWLQQTKPMKDPKRDWFWAAAKAAVPIGSVDRDDVPSQAAWSLFKWAKEDFHRFMESFSRIARPSQSQLDREAGFDDDGQNVLHVIAKVEQVVTPEQDEEAEPENGEAASSEQAWRRPGRPV